MMQDKTVVLNQRKMERNFGSYTIIFVTAALFIFLSVSTSTFFSYNNIYSLLFDISIEFFALIGFTYLMIMGEIDLSVGGVYGFTGVLLGFMEYNLKMPFVAALVISILVAALIGFANGYVVTKFKVNSMMVTLGMMSVAQGFQSALSSTSAIFPADYRDFIKFRIGDFHWSVVALIVILVVLEILLHKTTLFRKMYYIGNNLNSAKIYGIKADRIKLLTFVATAALAGFGGIIATSRITHAYPTTGSGLEFTMVTAAVLGGASLYGGRGSIVRSALGLLLLAVMQNGMIIFSIDPYLQQSVMGIILIAAVFADTRLNREKN